MVLKEVTSQRFQEFTMSSVAVMIDAIKILARDFSENYHHMMMVVMISVALCHTSVQPHAAPDYTTQRCEVYRSRVSMATYVRTYGT